MRSQPRIFSRDESGNLSAHIETENLIIRSIQEDDLGHMNDLMGNEEVMRFVGAEGARDEERISRTASGALEMRPRAFLNLICRD